MTDEEIDRMGKVELREELRRALRGEHEAISGRRSEEIKKEKAVELMRSARINVQSALSVQHLLDHGQHALGHNAHQNIHNFLTDAIADLDRAYEAADIIPF